MKDESERVSNRLPMDKSREHLMVKVARMTYQQELNQSEIAAETGLNRWQVSRLLQEARDLGIVRIEIIPRSPRRPDLETALQQTFNLNDSVVVSSDGEQAQSLDTVAQAAGQYIASIKSNGATVGVSWGRTMGAVAHWLPLQWSDGGEVVQINGTVAPISGVTYHNDVAGIFARKAGARLVPLPVPAIVGQRVTREVLERDRIVADVLTKARSAQILIFSCGSLSEESVLVRSGNILRDELATLLSKGAVGDVLGRFIDVNGEIVDAELDARTIGLSLSDLKTSGKAIGIAAGREKFNVVLGVLRAGLVNVLVTDEATATFALEHA
ncbi:sugar-binding transcriptional regulator [Sinorhizobium meliloti]|uniref:sugar-binding transcriptional regulator n=1 Tax=Rhizobium meliloti TaxID=382 RepID=UPI000FDCAE68|nr:sugar-binding transcriptional regulator [Sinorhizobium meliloti]RVP86870.1 sugar-binding transcriptional regulator [Sinorhizobium meliloti]